MRGSRRRTGCPGHCGGEQSLNGSRMHTRGAAVTRQQAGGSIHPFTDPYSSFAGRKAGSFQAHKVWGGTHLCFPGVLLVKDSLEHGLSLGWALGWAAPEKSILCRLLRSNTEVQCSPHMFPLTPAPVRVQALKRRWNF